VTGRIAIGAALMIGVLALIFDVPFLLPVVVALVGYSVLGVACTATVMLIRWMVKLLLEPVPRAAVALGTSLLLHGFAWWDGWHPFRDAYPLDEAFHVVVLLVSAHVPAALLLWRDLRAAPP